ncbi:MbeD/MobD like protein [Carboxydocella sporoproducens DSM 16521]|uniref:MbeD/MobD like protein n=3 Tax=Clostridiales Family XVI. Incertae Sedis TaxID=543347 RepID=A0A1T4PRL8_9FIRM|nr:MbeD/MobD like protein [Carboxydocella thermautotrophica]SJZ94284.1 MbeD/MobD like protein [Carboxydocella sporoproducens DSM 16521]
MLYQILHAVENLHSTFNQRFDRLEQRMDNLEQRMNGLEQRMDNLEQRVNGLEQRVDGIDTRQGELYLVTRSIEHRTEYISAALQRTTEDVVELSGKVENINKKLFNIQAYIDYQTSKIAENEREIYLLKQAR